MNVLSFRECYIQGNFAFFLVADLPLTLTQHCILQRQNWEASTAAIALAEAVASGWATVRGTHFSVETGKPLVFSLIYLAAEFGHCGLLSRGSQGHLQVR